jgi:prephenate dehydrogenase
MPPEMRTVAVAGVGLIGGSFALALRAAGFAGRILGVDSPAVIASARERGAIDAGADLAEACAAADLVYLAAPIEAILNLLEPVDQAVRPGTLITDAGSTKAAIAARAAAVVRRGVFVGGHPMAGKEITGVAGADSGLFAGRPYLLTGEPPAEFRLWLEKIGVRIRVLDPAEHDRLVAYTSHLPQLVATALALTIGSVPGSAGATGPAAREMTRLASSPFSVWHDILRSNAPNIRAALAALRAELDELEARLEQPEMAGKFHDAAAVRRRLLD